MDKQKDFLKMVRIIEPISRHGAKCSAVKCCKYVCKDGEIFPCDDCKIVTALQKQGIGDVKQAVREFAEKIYQEFDKMEEHCDMTADWNGKSIVSWCSSMVRELVKEVIGE